MSYTLTRILLATDGSADAMLASRAASDLATKMDADLHVVHVWQAPHFYSDAALMPQGAARFHESYERAAREGLAEQVQRIKAGGLAVAGEHLETGSPADEIVSLAERLGAGLIVLGSRGLGPVKRLLVGSVSEGVVHDASVPVLVLRGEEVMWPPMRIVVGDDGSEGARKAGELGAVIGRLFGATLDLVHAYPQLPYLKEVERIADPHIFADALRETGRAVQERADGLEELLGQSPHVHITEGDAATAVLKASEEGQEPALIALGSRGLSTLERMRLGSVSTKIFRAAVCPVLIYPHVTEARQ